MRSILQAKPFRPHRLLGNGHLQTVVGSQQRRSFSWGWKHSSLVTLELDGGVQIRARWVAGQKNAPTVVVVHGMGGSAESGYMLGISHKAWTRGWNSLLPDLYNQNRSFPGPKVFHSGCSADLNRILESSARQLGVGKLFLAGVSMGGNILLKLLGEAGEGLLDRVCGAAVISPLVDLHASWRIFDKRSNWLYRRYYLNRLCNITRQNAERVSKWVDLSRLNTIRTIRAFDENVTVPLSGFGNVDEYYSRASAIQFMGRIRVPTLILHSKDDPLLPWEALDQACRQNSRLLLELSNQGGHVAFLEREKWDLDRSWAENRLIDFLALFHG